MVLDPKPIAFEVRESLSELASKLVRPVQRVDEEPERVMFGLESIDQSNGGRFGLIAFIRLLKTVHWRLLEPVAGDRFVETAGDRSANSDTSHVLAAIERADGYGKHFELIREVATDGKLIT